MATMSLVNEDDPAKVWEFTYDANGMRTKRSYGDKVYTYVYSGSQLTAMTYSSHKFLFTYDAAGKPLTLEYHDTFDCQAHTGGSCGSSCKTYYYVTNLQGDVIALLDSSGNVKAEYAYDAWGNHVETPSSFIGNYNPLRYRGYVYDRETKLYYLQSRYYNPEIGRFISADAYVSTGQGFLGSNMFVYCLNNPVNIADVSGTRGEWLLKVYTFSTDAFKWLITNIAEPATDLVQDLMEQMPEGTRSTGVAVSAAYIFGGTLSGGITYDTKGNVGLIGTYALGAGVPAAAVCRYENSTNAPTIYHQRGKSYIIGGSAGALASFGGEYAFFFDSETGEAYHSGTLLGGVGVGVGAEAHVEVGNSGVIGFNVFDVLNFFYDSVKKW